MRPIDHHRGDLAMMQESENLLKLGASDRVSGTGANCPVEAISYSIGLCSLGQQSHVGREQRQASRRRLGANGLRKAGVIGEGVIRREGGLICAQCLYLHEDNDAK
jgi:hypothetical protein